MTNNDGIKLIEKGRNRRVKNSVINFLLDLVKQKIRFIKSLKEKNHMLAISFNNLSTEKEMLIEIIVKNLGKKITEIKDVRFGHIHLVKDNSFTAVLTDKDFTDNPMERFDVILKKKQKIPTVGQPIVAIFFKKEPPILIEVNTYDFKNTIIDPFVDYSKFKK